MDREPKICAILPSYGEGERVAAVVEAVRSRGIDAVVVDDGSRDDTAERAREAGATVLEHVQNCGKGMALFTGFEYAREAGYDLALTIDADGQHDPSDIPAFLAAWRRTGAALVVGNRMDAPGGMPRVRRWTNRWMSRSLSRIMRQHIPDTQCGFRLYHRSAFPAVPPAKYARRFAAESEFLLRLALSGAHIVSVPVQTIYAGQRSKIRPLRDAWRFWRLLGHFRKMERTFQKERGLP